VRQRANAGLVSALTMLLRSAAVVPLQWDPMYRFVGHPKGVPSATWTCGFCEAKTGNDRGWKSETSDEIGTIRLCPACGAPTFFDTRNETIPRPLPGHGVEHLPDDVATLYTECRRALQAEAFSASIMACRKILMHVAVDRGAPKKDTSFKQYVEYLDEHGYVPPDGKVWVDYIKDRGNDANHEIKSFTRDDADGVLMFTGALLRVVYELPGKVPGKPLGVGKPGK
jgi:hypothetical protein